MPKNKNLSIGDSVPKVLRRNEAVKRNLLPRRRLVRVVKRSRLAPHLGRAVVANEAIRCGQHVCVYAGRVLPNEECEKIVRQHSNPFCPTVSYFFLIDDDEQWVVDGNPDHTNTRDALASFINDPRGVQGAQQNCDFVRVWDKDNNEVLISVKATRNIACDEELWWSYGEDYWCFAGRDPDTPCSCIAPQSDSSSMEEDEEEF